MEPITYDTIIIGSGPAGFTAGIYTCRSQLKTLLIECFDPSSQAVTADWIENYPGFPEGIEGFGLIDKFKSQAKNFGLDFHAGKVDNISLEDKQGKLWQVRAEGKVFRSLAIILAVGASPKQLGIEGEKEFRGKGVSYCAICDGRLFKDKDIVVVGGGNSAVSEALYLTRFARKVVLVHRRNRLRAVSILVQRAKENKKIDFAWNSLVTKIYGKDKVEGVGLQSVIDQAQSRLTCSGVFVSVGLVPNTNFLGSLVKLDDYGYIITDQSMQTSAPGVFACGDCRAKPLRQIVTACGDGAVAGFSATEYVDRIKGRAYDR
ncbi:MAG: thioredoxin-disulfide reductase [Candidatus Omnitrophota bacterium]